MSQFHKAGEVLRRTEDHNLDVDVLVRQCPCTLQRMKSCSCFTASFFDVKVYLILLVNNTANVSGDDHTFRSLALGQYWDRVDYRAVPLRTSRP